MVLTYIRFVRDADELQKSIQLHALAFGFGATWLAMTGYGLFEELGAPVVNNNLAERDWTQAPLAHELDVSHQTVNAIETGKFDPSLPLAFRISRLFRQIIRAEGCAPSSANGPPAGPRPEADTQSAH